jgi:hypothetical protein
MATSSVFVVSFGEVIQALCTLRIVCERIHIPGDHIFGGCRTLPLSDDAS